MAPEQPEQVICQTSISNQCRCRPVSTHLDIELVGMLVRLEERQPIHISTVGISEP